MSKSVFKTNQMSSCNNSGSGICYVKSKKFALLEKMSNSSVNNDARNNNMKSIVDKHNYYDKSNFDKIQLLADLPVEKWHIISFIFPRLLFLPRITALHLLPTTCPFSVV